MADDLTVIAVVDGRGASENALIISCYSLRRCQHRRKVVLDFLFPAAGKQRYDRLGRLKAVSAAKLFLGLRITVLERPHLLGGRVAHIMNRIMMTTLIKRDFKRQYGEHLAHVALN